MNTPLFCVNLHWICCESAGTLVGGQLSRPLPSVFSSFGLAVLSLSLLFLAVHTSWQQVTQDSRWHESRRWCHSNTACCTCGCRRCWSQYYKPKPQALWQFIAYLCCAFFILFFFKNFFQNMRFVSLSWVFLLAIDVTWYKQSEFKSSVKC